MKKVYFIGFVFTTLVIVSCAGVIGNIHKYRFDNISKTTLKEIVEQVYSENPSMRDFDTVMYRENDGIGDGDYYCRIRSGEKDLLFVFAYPIYPQPKDTIVEIALTSAAPYGDLLELAKDISNSKKREYEKLFRKEFIDKIRNKISDR